MVLTDYHMTLLLLLLNIVKSIRKHLLDDLCFRGLQVSHDVQNVIKMIILHFHLFYVLLKDYIGLYAISYFLLALKKKKINFLLFLRYIIILKINESSTSFLDSKCTAFEAITLWGNLIFSTPKIGLYFR